MSAEDNRSHENLVLLCTDHSYEIDDPGLVQRFPVPLLIEWKQAQITEYDRAVEAAGSDAVVGYQLTDAEAAEVIEASEHNTNIALHAHTIQIGGSGGHWGGGGGGGGVVGSGVLIGGLGGDGQIPTIVLDGQPGMFPGAGGGGGGMLLHGTVEPPPRRGVEGYGYIAGVDGGDGGDTTISIDGQVILRAEGGKGALAGSGNRTCTDRLTVSTLLLADYINIMPHGLATVVNAGWGSTSVLNLPAIVTFPVFTVFEAGGADVGEYTVTYEVRGPDGEVRTIVNMALIVERLGDFVRVLHTAGLSTDVDAFGIWTVGIKSQVAQLATLDVMVKRVGEAEPPRVTTDSGAS